ncbi:hypothetical protein BDN72DRAFT_180031, partial [Pluteus cervinus]
TQQNLVPFPLNLILIARRVHHWLIPKIYETIIIHENKDKGYPIKWDRVNLEQFGHFVQNLFIQASPSPASSLLWLKPCPNVTNLSCWVHISQDMMVTMSHLRLTYLSINPNTIQHPSPSLIEAFATVTHLDCLGHVDIALGNIICFTSLTHIAVSRYNIIERPILPILFDRFPRLQAVISLKVADSYERRVSVVEDFDPDSDDPRVVKISFPLENGVGDWLEVVRHGRGIWGLADEAINSRRGAKGNMVRGNNPMKS